MKYIIASDIHGSAEYCSELLKAWKRENADRMLLLGDILYHGPRNAVPEGYDPKAVAIMLNERKAEILAVRGNCDAEIDQMILEFPISADYALLSWQKALIFITHGHLFNKACLPPVHTGDVLLHGHTHIPACEDIGGVMYLNPGSVTIPKDGSQRGYMLFENGVFTWKTLDGNEYMRYCLNNQ